MTVSPHLSFCAGDRCAPSKQLGNVRTSLEELSQVKIEMDFEVSLRPVAGIAGHTSVAFKGKSDRLVMVDTKACIVIPLLL